MRIGFYIPELARGGAERVVVNLAKQFKENKNSVFIITTNRIENEYYVDNSIGRYVLNEGLENSKCATIKRNKKLRKICRLEKIDILISFIGGANYQSVLATRGIRTKSIISVRNDPKFEYPRWIDQILIRFLLTKADGCVFQTEDAQRYFPEKLQKKSQIIYNAVADEFYKTPLKQKNTKQKIIVSCGRLTEQKNHKLLIETFSSVLKKHKDIILKIYGDGKLKKDLQLLINKLNIQNNIYLMGNTSDVASALAEASVFVLTSDFEGMPNALMEAMAMGLPCISTDCPCGGPKMLLGKEAGILIPKGDKECLYNAMVEVLENQEKRKKIALKASEKAQYFKTDNIFQEWYDYIMFVLYGK